MGWFVFLFLTSLSALTALSIAVRARLSGRAELWLATTALWNFLILTPVVTLGLLHRLYANTLGWTSLVFFSVTMGVSFIGSQPAQHARDLGAAVWGLIKLPWDAWLLAWRAKSVVAVGVAFSGGLILYTIWLSYLAPSDAWDGIWYHETMVGYAIQSGGFQPVDVPMTLQHINGFARFCECINLWFVIFTGKRLIEVVNSLYAPAMVLAVYALARRFTTDRVTAMGWGCSLILMPGALLELRSTYIDVHWATICLLAVYFCTRPKYRMRDAWLTIVCLTILISSKNVALLWAPTLALIASVRLMAAHIRKRPSATLTTIIAGAGLIIAGASFTYLRNWLNFHNPVWPLLIDNQRLGIHWPGWTFNVNVFDQDKPLSQVLKQMYSLPVPGQDWADTRIYGYGLGIPFFTLPLALVAAVSAAVLVFSSLLRRLVGAKSDNPSENQLFHMLLVVVPIVAAGYFSPSLAMARFDLHIVGLVFVLVAWWLGRFGLMRLGEGAVAINILTSLMMLWWADPGWGVSLKEAMTLAKLSPVERSARPTTSFSITPATAAARDRELGPGSVLAYSEDYAFPGVLWNDNYSNKLVYVPFDGNVDGYLARLDQIGATWAVHAPGNAQYRALSSQPTRWQEVGAASQNHRTVAFRRVR